MTPTATPEPMKPLLIALYSPCPQSGKTTAAKRLCERWGFARVSFANPIKAGIRAMLSSAGEDMFAEGVKDSPMTWLGGKTPRQLAQSLGTDWGRNMIDPDLWVYLAMASTLILRNRRYPVVIDDMRFPNEFEAVEAAGGLTVLITRKGHQMMLDHASEALLNGYQFDLCLTDLPTGVEHVNAAVDEMMERIMEARTC